MCLGFHLIIAVVLLIGVGLIITYTMSVTLSGVNPLWCYISYTGNHGVESCIFSLVFSLSSALYVFIVFLRFVQVTDILEKSTFTDKKMKTLTILNGSAMFCGSLGSFGFCLAGCFQQRIFHLVHIIGVLFCTYFTLGYVLLQTYFSFAIPLLGTSSLIKAFRAIIAILTSLIIAAGSIFTLCYLVKQKKKFDLLSSNTEYDRSFGYRLGSGLEWLLFILNQMFISSLCPDFKKILLKTDEIVLL